MKRGQITQELYMIIIEVILVSSAGLMLFNYVDSMKDNTLYDKQYLAKDISLLVTTLYMAPGNVQYHYTYPNHPMDSFDFYFKPTTMIGSNEVGVADSNVRYPYTISYPYASDSEITNELTQQISPDELWLTKTGSLITSRQMSLNMLKCIPPKFYQELDSILIIFEGDVKEFYQIAVKLQTYSYRTGRDIYLSHVPSEGKLIRLDNRPSDPDLTVYLRNTDADYAKAYYTYGDGYARYLACSLVNSALLVKDMPVINVPREYGERMVIEFESGEKDAFDGLMEVLDDDA